MRALVRRTARGPGLIGAAAAMLAGAPALAGGAGAQARPPEPTGAPPVMRTPGAPTDTVRADTVRADTVHAALDSLRERLRAAEEAIALLRDDLGTQAAASVQTTARVRAELFGRVLTNAFVNSAPVNNADVPLFALPTAGRSGAGATIRQTSFGVAVTVQRVLGGDFVGDLHADFFGGQQPSTGGRHFPLLRLRTARAVVRWPRAELLVGQEAPLVAGTDPVSLASFGTPEFTAAGNLWLWLPQARFTTELGTPLRLALQAAVLSPTSGDPANAFDTAPDSAEQSKRPYLQLRLRARWGDGDAAGELGVGVHRGWLRRASGALVVSDAVVVGGIVPLGARVALRGEAYTGQALRGLGGGGIGQNLTTDGRPVEDRGGWLQLDVRPTTWLQLGTGCGVADPDDDALPQQRLRNRSCEAHVITRPAGPLVAALEYRRTRTSYPARAVGNEHVNLAVGFEF